LSALAGVVLGNVLVLVLALLLAGHRVAGVVLPTSVAAAPWQWTVVLLFAPRIAVVLGGLRPARKAAALEPDVALRDW
jgi:ABC-type lipoprotein release transport system permease subunit